MVFNELFNEVLIMNEEIKSDTVLNVYYEWF